MTAFTPREDPFGSRPSVRRRGWVRIVLGAVMAVAGVVTFAVGIVQAVGAHGRIEGDAVARGVVREGAAGAVAFEVPPGERRSYTVYLLFAGRLPNSEDQDLTVRDTGCLATMPDGATTFFRGARQGIAVTLGDAASVGHFSSQPGRVRLSCGYVSGTRRSQRRRPDGIAFVVTPGRPTLTGDGTAAIVVGVAAAALGSLAAAWGWRGRRRPTG